MHIEQAVRRRKRKLPRDCFVLAFAIIYIAFLTWTDCACPVHNAFSSSAVMVTRKFTRSRGSSDRSKVSFTVHVESRKI